MNDRLYTVSMNLNHLTSAQDLQNLLAAHPQLRAQIEALQAVINQARQQQSQQQYQQMQQSLIEANKQFLAIRMDQGVPLRIRAALAEPHMEVQMYLRSLNVQMLGQGVPQILAAIDAMKSLNGNQQLLNMLQQNADAKQHYIGLHMGLSQALSDLQGIPLVNDLAKRQEIQHQAEMRLQENLKSIQELQKQVQAVGIASAQQDLLHMEIYVKDGIRALQPSSLQSVQSLDAVLDRLGHIAYDQNMSQQLAKNIEALNYVTSIQQQVLMAREMLAAVERKEVANARELENAARDRLAVVSQFIGMTNFGSLPISSPVRLLEGQLMDLRAELMSARLSISSGALSQINAAIASLEGVMALERSQRNIQEMQKVQEGLQVAATRLIEAERREDIRQQSVQEWSRAQQESRKIQKIEREIKQYLAKTSRALSAQARKQTQPALAVQIENVRAQVEESNRSITPPAVHRINNAVDGLGETSRVPAVALVPEIADSVAHWQRELIQARETVAKAQDLPPQERELLERAAQLRLEEVAKDMHAMISYPNLAEPIREALKGPMSEISRELKAAHREIGDVSGNLNLKTARRTRIRTVGSRLHAARIKQRERQALLLSSVTLSEDPSENSSSSESTPAKQTTAKKARRRFVIRSGSPRLLARLLSRAASARRSPFDKLLAKLALVGLLNDPVAQTRAVEAEQRDLEQALYLQKIGKEKATRALRFRELMEKKKRS
jgi:hypothetical protein